MDATQKIFEKNLEWTILVLVILGLIGLTFQVSSWVRGLQNKPSTPAHVPRIDDFTHVDKGFPLLINLN